MGEGTFGKVFRDVPFAMSMVEEYLTITGVVEQLNI